MRSVLHLSELPEDEGDGSVVLAADVADMRRLWLMLLAMAVRDEANVLRWQPWESGHVLSYTVGATQYGLMEPGEEFGGVAFEAARRLISPGARGWATRQLFRAGTGVLECVSAWGPSRWHGAWWSAGAATGVEFVRLDRFPVPPPPVMLEASSNLGDGGGAEPGSLSSRGGS